jgi:hypothetical protein
MSRPNQYVIRYTGGGSEYVGRYMLLERDAEGRYTGVAKPVPLPQDATSMSKAQAEAIANGNGDFCEAVELTA